ncbi:nucleotidyltransferase family protein [Tepidanaerobacter acetatoxydans]|uniref:nucleotidyltransferase family protein n=1 Tax=Tepidanaerobacter acetatoxydans TaxID=499229 RepID=UPI00235B5E2D|nr:nucleotidyltransferase domain-containing protein [Tepidanaerobacter acetatoxydans]
MGSIKVYSIDEINQKNWNHNIFKRNEEMIMTSEEMIQYKEHLKKTVEVKKQYLEKRYKKAWGIAKKAAAILHQKYKAEKVWVFGSLANKEMFNLWSDIDIAVKGIPPELFYKSVGEVTSLASDFSIDVVDIEDCSSSLRENIEKGSILV